MIVCNSAVKSSRLEEKFSCELLAQKHRQSDGQTACSYPSNDTQEYTAWLKLVVPGDYRTTSHHHRLADAFQVALQTTDPTQVCVWT